MCGWRSPTRQPGLLLGGVVTVLAALLVGRRMLRAALHELRHPLTALAWAELDGLSRRLGELLDDLLLLARQEQAGLDGPMNPAKLLSGV